MRIPMLVFLALLSTMTSSIYAADTQTAKAGKYTVTLATSPAPAVGKNQLKLTVTDNGKPLTGAGIKVHAEMKGMTMSSDADAAPGAKAGEYTADIELSMAGQWVITVDVQAMAGMDMDGDGKASFTVDAQTSGSGNPTAPDQPAEAKNPHLKLILGIVIAIVLYVAIVSRRAKRTSP